MSAQAGSGEPANYFRRLSSLVAASGTQLLRPPSEAQHAVARRLSRQILWTTAVAAVLIIALMAGFDTTEIALMPPRGTAGLWPARILTDFGKDANVLLLLGAMLIAVMLIAPRFSGGRQDRLLAFGLRLQFLFFAVAVPLVFGEVLKWIAGRGRPFVGGKANAFNFTPFAGTEAHASFPSAHSITAFALAFAVAAIWPRTRGIVFVYALIILATRLVLLAHHPSDVVAGAAIGLLGAMAVRYWFAVRGLGFAIGRDGVILPISMK